MTIPAARETILQAGHFSMTTPGQFQATINRPYLNFEWTITFGQALPYIMTFVGIAGAAILGWFVNRVKKVLLEEWAALVEAFKVTTNKTLT
ncbi:MAG TPA: hypothetical protein VLZ53_11770, partial [Devosia sp.]|nr:hypothetical protein [Devosia sp.]